MINKIVKIFILEDLFLRKMYSNQMKNILLLRDKKEYGDGFADNIHQNGILHV